MLPIGHYACVLRRGVVALGVAVLVACLAVLRASGATPSIQIVPQSRDMGASVAASTSIATTTTSVPCVYKKPLLIREQPSTIHLTADDSHGRAQVPVGTIFVVSLEKGKGCDGPEWSQPIVHPQ